MADIRKHSSTSNLIRFTLKNSSTGVGLTGLSSASSGLIISTIADNEATATAYTVAGSTIESITTLGTFATPTATKCRFKEVDATNHKGLYEFQFADARFSVASAKRLVVSVTGATSLLDADYEVQLVSYDPYDTVRLGLTALPNAAAEAAGGLYTRGTGAGQIAQDANGNIRANLDTIKTQTVTCAAGVTVLASVGTAATDTAQTGDAFARLGAPAGASVSADVAAVKAVDDAIKVKTDYLPSATAGAAGGVFIAGANAATSVTTALTANITGNLSGSVGSVTGAVGSVTAGVTVTTNNDKTGYALTQTFPTNFSAMVITAGGIVDADVEAVTGDTGSAAKLKRVLIGNVTGTVGVGSTTTSIVTSSLNPAASVADQYKGRIITFDDATTTAALRGQSSDITANTNVGVLTVTALTSAAVSGDTFTIS